MTRPMSQDDQFKLGLLNDALAYNESLGETGTFTYQRLTQLKADLLASYSDDAPAKLPTPVKPVEMEKVRPAARSNAAKPVRPEDLATAAQNRYIAKLVAERQVPEKGGLQTGLARFRDNQLSRRGASALIDWLKELPIKGTDLEVRLATPKQMASLIKEGGRRSITEPLAQAAVDAATQGREVPFDVARSALDHLFNAPYCTPKPTTKVAIDQDGMYRLGDRIIKVQVAVHGSGQLYAKELIGHEVPDDEDGSEFKTVWKFEYVAGLVGQLTPENRMTLEEARQFGKLYGVCCVCSKTLTKEESIEAGIGPVCGGRV